MFSSLCSSLKIWRIKKAIQQQDVDKLKSFFKKEKDLEILFSRNIDTTLIEEILLSDYVNSNDKTISFFASFFSKYPNFKEKFYNFTIDLNGEFFKFKEAIFIVPDCFFALEFLIENKLISINEEIVVDFCIDNTIQKVKTILPYYSFIYSNKRAIQYFLLEKPYLFKFRDSLNNQFLFYALISSEDSCVDLLIETESNNTECLEKAFFYLEKLLKNEPHLDLRGDTINVIVSNINRFLSQTNIDVNNIVYNQNTSIIVNAILNDNLKFLDLLFYRCFVDFSKTFRHYHLVDIASKFFKFNVLIKLKEYKKGYYIDFFKPINTYKGNTYVDYIDIPYYLILNEKDNFDFTKYKEFLSFSMKDLNADITKINKYGNSHLHSICSVLSNNFEEYFKVFRLFIEIFKLDPCLLNNVNRTPLSYIKDKKHYKQAVKYLKTQGIDYENSLAKKYELERAKEDF